MAVVESRIRRGVYLIAYAVDCEYCGREACYNCVDEDGVVRILPHGTRVEHALDVTLQVFYKMRRDYNER